MERLAASIFSEYHPTTSLLELPSSHHPSSCDISDTDYLTQYEFEGQLEDINIDILLGEPVHWHFPNLLDEADFLKWTFTKCLTAEDSVKWNFPSRLDLDHNTRFHFKKQIVGGTVNWSFNYQLPRESEINWCFPEQCPPEKGTVRWVFANQTNTIINVHWYFTERCPRGSTINWHFPRLCPATSTINWSFKPQFADFGSINWKFPKQSRETCSIRWLFKKQVDRVYGMPLLWGFPPQLGRRSMIRWNFIRQMPELPPLKWAFPRNLPSEKDGSTVNWSFEKRLEKESKIQWKFNKNLDYDPTHGVGWKFPSMTSSIKPVNWGFKSLSCPDVDAVTLSRLASQNPQGFKDRYIASYVKASGKKYANVDSRIHRMALSKSKVAPHPQGQSSSSTACEVVY